MTARARLADLLARVLDAAVLFVAIPDDALDVWPTDDEEGLC